MTYTTGLNCSKAIHEALKGTEIESEKVCVERFVMFNDEDRIVSREHFKKALDNSILSDGAKKLIKSYPSYSLSELAEVLKALGERLGWKEEYKHRIAGGDRPALKCSDCDRKPMIGDGRCYANFFNEWKDNYLKLCEIWATTQSQERCDEFLISLLKQ